jgi:hypothetical protein
MTQPNWANMKFFILADAIYGPYRFPAEVPLVITRSDDPNFMFINLDSTLSQIDAQLQNNPNSPTGPNVIAPDAGVIITQVMTALLNGLSTGLSALGPEFGAGAGVLTGLAGLLGASWTQPSPPPDPPSLADIKNALGDVTQLADAQKAGQFFTSSYLWFVREAQSIAFYGKGGKVVPPTLQQEYESAVTDALSPDPGSLYNTLFYISAHPEIGQYILPEFLTGIGLYIHLKRIHLGEIFLQAAQTANSHTGVVDPNQIQDLLTDATTLQSGFTKAQAAFESMRNQIVVNHGLSNIPEAMLAMKKVSQTYTGDPYAVVDPTYAATFPSGCLVTDDAGQTSWLYNEKGYPAGYQDPILDGNNQITSVAKLIQEDLTTVQTNGGWPQNMFNVNWGQPDGEIQGLTTNLALTATATASSQDTSTGQTADKAIDGVIGGYPGTPYNVEWATTGGGAGSWLKLTWASAQTFNTIVLYDRPNPSDQITGGNIQFSDGSSVTVAALPNDGSACTLSFPAKTATWLQLNITSVSATTTNVGLAEIQVYNR